MTEALKCPLCGADRTMYEHLIAECYACGRDTFEDRKPGFYASKEARRFYPWRPESWR